MTGAVVGSKWQFMLIAVKLAVVSLATDAEALQTTSHGLSAGICPLTFITASDYITEKGVF